MGKTNLHSWILKQLRRAIHAPLTQVQREALLDLLVWVAMVDRKLDPPEQEMIQQEADELDWHGDVAVAQYIEQSAARARRLPGDDQAAQAYLDDIASRLDTARSRRYAVDACAELTRVDDRSNEAEQQLLRQLRDRLSF